MKRLRTVFGLFHKLRWVAPKRIEIALTHLGRVIACALAAVGISLSDAQDTAATPAPGQTPTATLPPVVVESAPPRVVVEEAPKPAVIQTPRAPIVEEVPAPLIIDDVGGFFTTDTSSGTKMSQPVFESPFAIQTVSSEVMEDQKPDRLEDVLRNISSVSKSGSDYNGLYDIFTIRGFPLSNYGQVYRDGFRQVAPQVNLDNIETVEVLKGASGSLFGRIEPGGLINLITKKPQTEEHYSFEQQIGSFNMVHSTLDATGPVSGVEGLLYRFVAGYEQGDSYRDVGEYSRLIIAPSFSWELGPDTRVDLSMEYKKNEDSLDGGQVALGNRPANIPGERYLGVVGVPLSPSEHGLVDASITHEFNDNWKGKIRGTWWNWKANYLETGPLDGAYPNGTVDLYHFASEDNDTTWFAEATLEGTFDTGSIGHHVLLGTDYYQLEFDRLNYFSFAPDIPLRPLNIFNPTYQHYSELPAVSNQYAEFGGNEWWGAYLQDVISLTDRLDVLVSARYDITSASKIYDEKPWNTTNPIDVAAGDYNKLTPRAGFNYEITPEIAGFGSYSESFSDSAFGFLANGDITKPETASQYEAGLKGRFLDGRVTTTLAGFVLTKENLTTALPNPAFVAQTGEAESRGFEFDLSGEITDEFSVIFTYSHLDTEITNDRGPGGGPGNTGNVLPNAPEDSASLWATYDLPKGFVVGGGLVAVDDRQGDLDNSFLLESYVRADAMVGYRFQMGGARMTAQLNVTNLSDEDYYDGSGGSSRTYIYAAEPRTFVASMKIEY